MAEATIGGVTGPATRPGAGLLARHQLLVRLLVRAYLSTGIAAAIFALGYGLSLLDVQRCATDGWTCAVPRAMMLAGFLAVALAVLVYAAHRTGLGMSWFLIASGLAGLVLLSGAPLPLLVVLLLPVPGAAATLVLLIRSRLGKA